MLREMRPKRYEKYVSTFERSVVIYSIHMQLNVYHCLPWCLGCCKISQLRREMHIKYKSKQNDDIDKVLPFAGKMQHLGIFQDAVKICSR